MPMRFILMIALICLAAACQKPASTPEDNVSGNASNWSGPQAPAPVAGEGTLPAGKLDRSHSGTQGPEVAFQDPDGKPIGLVAFRGKPVLVNLWATWCGPCVIEMPTIDALARRDAGKLQVVVISQDMGDGARSKVAAFFADHKFHQLKPYLDSKMDLMSALKVEVLPTTILYGSDGKEIWRITGIEDWQGEDAAKLLGEAK
jgi:thiol-disulfide isomerase/thioredoxin